MSFIESHAHLSTHAEPLAVTATDAVPLVRFSNVYKTYDGHHAVVRGLDLDIRRGEFLTLLGPSGSGKTTTLMMLAGFESPSAGEILLDGRSITRIPPHQRNFGMVFQNYALFPHMTVGQNVAYPLSVRKMPKPDRERCVGKALEMVRLHGMTDRFPSQLSGGQQQRVALARAMVFEPRLVLMDEPLGALDKQLREHMQVELKELQRQLGVTFVYVTHDQGEALTMSDRVAVFNDGAIQQIDRVDRLYEEPASRFVASFVGDTALLSGTSCRPRGPLGGIALHDGRLLAGVNVDGVEAGQQAHAAIRPERIVVHGRAPAHQINLLQGQVRNVLYFGDHLRLLCSVGADMPDVPVKLPLAAAWKPAVGDAVWLEFPAQSTRIYR